MLMKTPLWTPAWALLLVHAQNPDLGGSEDALANSATIPKDHPRPLQIYTYIPQL